MLFNDQLFNPKKISYDTKKEKKLMLINTQGENRILGGTTQIPLKWAI
jgi:hypothetical protein